MLEFLLEMYYKQKFRNYNDFEYSPYYVLVIKFFEILFSLFNLHYLS